MEAEVTILVDSYNADFLKSLTHIAQSLSQNKLDRWGGSQLTSLKGIY